MLIFMLLQQHNRSMFFLVSRNNKETNRQMLRAFKAEPVAIVPIGGMGFR